MVFGDTVGRGCRDAGEDGAGSERDDQDPRQQVA